VTPGGGNGGPPDEPRVSTIMVAGFPAPGGYPDGSIALLGLAARASFSDMLSGCYRSLSQITAYWEIISISSNHVFHTKSFVLGSTQYIRSDGCANFVSL
jgi:hypothetical protein